MVQSPIDVSEGFLSSRVIPFADGTRRSDSMLLSWTDILEKVAIAIGGYFTRILQTSGTKRRMRQELYGEICRNYHKSDPQIHLFHPCEWAGLRGP
jgi:2-iminoacetate synthase ThiH